MPDDPVPPGPPDPEDPTSAAGPAMALSTAADLQDHLMIATNDLDRLQQLLQDASDSLMQRFYAVMDHLQALRPELRDASALDAALQEMGGAVTSLQFQDMASQLIAHTHRRLRNGADLLARDAMGDDEDGEVVVETAPLRPNPVTQAEMDAGSVELF